MPIKRAAYKALRSDKKKRARNLSAMSRIKTLAKNLTGFIQSKDKKETDKSLKALISALDKAAQKGIMHKKTASRKAARMSKRASQAFK